MNYLALIVGKLAGIFLRLVGRSGGSLPGKLALRLAPHILKKFHMPATVILVTGTNGKTSLANMIARIMKESGVDVRNNAKGDNIAFGIVSMLIRESSLRFKIRREALVIEIDELTMANRLHEMQVSHILIGNFFRDQLDRAGEMETLIRRIGNALQHYNGMLILNADDPNVYRLRADAVQATIRTYGAAHAEGGVVSGVKEGHFCPQCESNLAYDWVQYSHIGSYHCAGCTFQRPKPDCEAENVDAAAGTFTMEGHDYRVNLPALYHIYNCIGAYAVIRTLEIDPAIYARVIADIHTAPGRMEMIDGCLLNLVKNPTGANEVLNYIRRLPGEKVLLFLLNDGVADGRDVSWIWDMALEDIDGLSTVICTGRRAYDMALRFRYGGFQGTLTVIESMDEAVRQLKAADGRHFAIANYTGLFALRKELRHGA
ncbi:MAG: MurT ligase domain-containing protein [Eubacteriales bacterium]|nr:MurT ligase domain-containing protein [Eubacteriales bacterium]